MYSITHKGKVLMGFKAIDRAIDRARNKAERDLIYDKLHFAMMYDARQRYEREKDPYKKEEMKYFMDRGCYNFITIFGEE